MKLQLQPAKVPLQSQSLLSLHPQNAKTYIYWGGGQDPPRSSCLQHFGWVLPHPSSLPVYTLSTATSFEKEDPGNT